MTKSQLENLIGSFITWAWKRNAALSKRLGPKLYPEFMQYVELFQGTVEKPEDRICNHKVLCEKYRCAQCGHIVQPERDDDQAGS